MARGSSGLQTSTAAYAYWSFPKSAYVTLVVLNAGVDVAFGSTLGAGGPEAANFTADEYFPPGTLLRPELFDAVRIKSHVAASPAQYNISARLVTDLPPGVPLGASFSPTYITIDPSTGEVGAVFSGVIQAQGVTINQGKTVVNQVQWVDVNGAQVAKVVTYTFTFNGDLETEVDIQSRPATVPQGATYVPGAVLSLISSLGLNTRNIASVSVANAAGTKIYNRIIVDGAGNSSFLQMSSAQPFNVVWGVVKFDGTVLNGGTSDWTVTNPVAGRYVLTYPATVTGVPLVIATAITSGSGVTMRCATLPSSTTVTVDALTPAGSLDSNDFSFAVIG